MNGQWKALQTLLTLLHFQEKQRQTEQTEESLVKKCACMLPRCILYQDAQIVFFKDIVILVVISAGPLKNCDFGIAD